MANQRLTTRKLADVVERTARCWPRHLSAEGLRDELSAFARDIERVVRGTMRVERTAQAQAPVPEPAATPPLRGHDLEGA